MICCKLDFIKLSKTNRTGAWIVASFFCISLMNSACAHYPWSSAADFPFGFTLASSFPSSGSYPAVVGSLSSSASPSSSSSSCGGSMSLSYGTSKYIMSPRYPEAYPPNTQCRWEITAPVGYRIALSFENLMMPPDEVVGCTGDRIEVLDIQYTFRVCFSQYGAYYLTLAPSVTVLFTSDRIREDFPARFRIRLELNRSWCGGDLTEASGDILSPNYPHSYPPNTVCGWKIQVPVGSRINLKCGSSFWLEPSVDCTQDFLAVSTSGDESMKTSSRFCGTRGPETLTSVSNVMTVFFNSNLQFEFTGFQCRYEMIGGTSYRYPNLLASAVSQNSISVTTSPLSSPFFPSYPLISTVAASPAIIQCDCGLSNKKSTREARIVGGTQTEVNEYPWVVAIFKRDGRQYCAGSLINELYILTASHCVARLRPSDIYVSLGDHDLDITEEARHVIVKVRRIVVHPGYRSTPVETDDIALLELSQPPTKTSNVRPICLPATDVDIRGQTPTVVGWGKLSEAGLSTSVLRETALPIQPNGECQRAYGYSVVTDNMICAGQLDGTTDACQGDSGGPMMVTEQSRWHIIGLVSYGFGCARPEFPGVYTRIDRYLDWIRENTLGSSLCSTPPPPPPPLLPQPSSLFAARPQHQDLQNRIFNRFGWGWNFDRSAISRINRT